VWMRHGETQTHKTHHGPDFKEATTFPLIGFSMFDHEVYTQMSFCPGNSKLGVPKFPKLGLSWIWRPITSCVDLQLKWILNQSCSCHGELSNGMWHVTCTQIMQNDFQFLVVRSEIDNLTLDLLLAITYILSTWMSHVN
jgi:hypothetical protein